MEQGQQPPLPAGKIGPTTNQAYCVGWRAHAGARGLCRQLLPQALELQRQGLQLQSPGDAQDFISSISVVLPPAEPIAYGKYPKQLYP